MGCFLEWPVPNTCFATHSQHDIVKLEAEGIKQEVKPEILWKVCIPPCLTLGIQPHSLPEIKKQRKKRCLNAWESFGSTGCIVTGAYSVPISLILFQGCWENYDRAQGGLWSYFEHRVAQGIPPLFTYWWWHVWCRQQWEISYARPPLLANARVPVGNQLMLYWISTLIIA